MLILFDHQENPVGRLTSRSLTSCVQSEPLNGLVMLDFTVDYENLDAMDEVSYVAHKDAINANAIQMYKILTSVPDNQGMTYQALHIVHDDMKGYGYVRERALGGVQAGVALSAALEGSRWQVGRADPTEAGSVHFYDNSRQECIAKILETWDVELGYRIVFTGNQITGRYIDLYARRGVETGRRYAYGRGALEVVREESQAGLYTAAIGRGKGEQKFDDDGEATGGYGRRINFSDVVWSKAAGDPVDKPAGQEYVEIPEMTAQFGYSDGSPRMKVCVYQDIEDPAALLQKTYEELLVNSRPLVQFRATITEAGNLELGDTVSIIRKELGIYYKTRVFSVKRDLLGGSLVEINLGDNLDVSQADYNRSLRKELSTVENNIAGAMESAVRWMQQTLSESMFDDDAYYYRMEMGNAYQLPAGLYTFDRPIDQNPTKALYFGAGKLAVSNRKDSQDRWIWSTWATGDGMVADVVTSGILQGGRVRFNLSDGTFLIGDSPSDHEMYYDGNTLLIGTDVDISANESITSRVTKEQILTDPEIQDALKGADGQDLTKTWTHVKFARDGVGTDMSDLPEDRTYIGIGMEKPYPTPSTDHMEYYWGTFRNSSYGVSLRDGKFAWVKFADTNTGIGLSDNPDNKRYVGIAIKTSQYEGNNAYDYEWSPIYEREIIVQPTEPTEVYPTGQIWLDTSMVPSQLKRWTGSEWEVVNDTSQLENILSGKLGEQDVQDLIEAIAGSMISTSETEISQTTDAITQRVTQTIAALDAYGRHLTALEEKQEMVWRLTADGIEFGETGNPIRTVQKPDRYAFIDQAGNEVAYFSNWELFVNSLHIPIAGTLKHGPLMWTFRSNGNYDLIRVGE